MFFRAPLCCHHEHTSVAASCCLFLLPHNDMPPKAKRWGKEQQNECTKQFNLFTTSNGKEGWDPREQTAEYVKPRAQQNDVCRPFLAANLGGSSSNKDSQKVVHGYRKAASEYWVKLAKSGIRRRTCDTCVASVSPLSHLFILPFSISFSLCFTTGDYLSDQGTTGKQKATVESEVNWCVPVNLPTWKCIVACCGRAEFKRRNVLPIWMIF